MKPFPTKTGLENIILYNALITVYIPNYYSYPSLALSTDLILIFLSHLNITNLRKENLKKPCKPDLRNNLVHLWGFFLSILMLSTSLVIEPTYYYDSSPLLLSEYYKGEAL